MAISATLWCLSLLILGTYAASTSMPVGNLTNWRQVFTDDFITPVALGSFPGPYANKWTSYTGFNDTSEKGQYDMYKVLSVSNGILNFYMHTDPVINRPLGAAPVPLVYNNQWGGQIYGRFSLRFRADSLPGYGTGWLLWSDENNWNEGEIDFPEGELSGSINAFAHCVGNPRENCFANNTGVTYTDWHIATIEWAPTYLKFILDDVVVGYVTDLSAIPTEKFHWVLQACTVGVTPDPSVSGNIQIDWAVVYAYDTTARAPTPAPTPKPTTKPTSKPTPKPCSSSDGVWTDGFSTINSAKWRATNGNTWSQTYFKSSQVKPSSTGLVLNMTKSGCPSQCGGLAQQSGKIGSVNNYQFGTIKVSIQPSSYATLWLGWQSSGPRDGYEFMFQGNNLGIQYYANGAYSYIGYYSFNATTSPRRIAIARTSGSLAVYANGAFVTSVSKSGLPQSSGEISFTLQSDNAITTQSTTAKLSSFTFYPAGCPYSP